MHSLRTFIADYGYWAVALALLAESAGIPVPGEITLLLASFLAYSERHLHVGWIIVAGTCAATLGGNLGYAIGEYGGRPLLDRYQSLLRISPELLERGEKMFERYGAAAIFFSRFIFGLRVFGGPRRRAADALATIYSLQLSRRGHMGHFHQRRGLSLRPPLADAAAGDAALQYCCIDHRRGRDRFSMVEISAPGFDKKGLKAVAGCRVVGLLKDMQPS